MDNLHLDLEATRMAHTLSINIARSSFWDHVIDVVVHM